MRKKEERGEGKKDKKTGGQEKTGREEKEERKRSKR